LRSIRVATFMSQRFCLQHFRTGLFVKAWKLVYP
jgi:hypothetical protein